MTAPHTDGPPRDFVGYGETPPDARWPGGARVAGTGLVEGGSMNTDRRNSVDTTRHLTPPPVVQPIGRVTCSLRKVDNRHFSPQ